MSTWATLRNELTTIETEIKALKAQGWKPYPADFVLDTTTVRGKGYYRRRVRREDGKPGKAEIISTELYSRLNQQLANGRTIHRLEKRKAAVVAKLDAIALQAREMGLSLPG